MTPTEPIDPRSLNHRQIQAGVGALIGAAVGDALGAPFEFQGPGSYSARFPKPVHGGIGEMVGGGGFGWAPGEFTDDTQMAMALGMALVAHEGEYSADSVWQNFKAWSLQATDIGMTTRAALAGPDHRTAAETAHEENGFSASNGSLMRIAPVGIAGVRMGASWTAEVARAQSRLTHSDVTAGLSAATAAELIRQLIVGVELGQALADVARRVQPSYRTAFKEMLTGNLDSGFWGNESNGLAVVCLAQAVWAVRSTSSFEDAVVAAVNLGGDTDTVAAVAGAIAGALYGIQQIPARWVTYVHGHVRQPDGTTRTFHQHDLVAMAHDLLRVPTRAITPPETPIPPTEVHELGVLASNLLGATQAGPDTGIVSLCRMEDLLHGHPHRREFWIIDQWEEGHNPHLRAVTEDAVRTIDAFLAEGREVVVHCHGGRSRTGFILKAWYMKRHGVDHDAADEWLSGVWPHYTTWNTDFFDFLTNDWGK